MGFWATWGPTIIGAASSILGGMMGGSGGVEMPDEPPEYAWIRARGPGIWDLLAEQGRGDIENPYGLGESRGAMERLARGTSAAGYAAARRGIGTNLALSGLSRGGGYAARQEYTAGREFAESLERGLSNIEIADFQAREAQKQRGINTLLATTNKSPLYAQIASQNYWNALNMANQQSQGWGNIIGNIGGMISGVLANRNVQNPYTTGTGFNYYGGYGGPSNVGGAWNPYSGYNNPYVT